MDALGELLALIILTLLLCVGGGIILGIVMGAYEFFSTQEIHIMDWPTAFVIIAVVVCLTIGWIRR